MQVVGRALDSVAVADVSVEENGQLLQVRFFDGRTAAIRVADLPFGSHLALAGRVSVDGSFVTLDGPDGPFHVTAHELAALAADRSLDRPDLAKRVGENLRAERTTRGLSLRDLAAVSGIAAPNLSNFENGRTTPRLETLGRLAEALGVTVASLVATDRQATGYAGPGAGPVASPVRMAGTGPVASPVDVAGAEG